MPASSSVAAFGWIILCCQTVISGNIDKHLPTSSEYDAQIAIIIDDLGNNTRLDNQALRLPGDITYSILPQLPGSKHVANTAYNSHREVMLHLPMDAISGKPLGPGAITAVMSRLDLESAINKNLLSVPHVVGVNNHMGSQLTQNPTVMNWLMQQLKRRKLVFIDSRTTANSVAERVAKSTGIAHARRRVFLDNDQDIAKIAQQFAHLIHVAKREGHAIGIGHPYPETLTVLKQLLPTLKHSRIKLVRASELTTQSATHHQAPPSTVNWSENQTLSATKL